MGKEIKHPKVSVIIPVYNTEKYLRECLDSVVNQTLKDIEIICVDDGSTDNSPKILKEYAAKDKRFVILEQENQGAGAARNKGLETAKGEYLSFLDSDDYFDLQMLEKMYASGSAYGADMVVCEASKFDDLTGKIITVFGINMKKVPKGDCILFDQIKDNWSNIFIPAVWNKLYKAQFVKDNKLRFQNISSCNDIGFSLCATSVSSKIAIIPEVLVYYRKNTKSCISHSRGEHAINIILAYKFILEFLENHKLISLKKCLDESIKNNIKYEISNCDSLQFYKFKRQAKKILGPDWLRFKSCFKIKTELEKFFLNIFSIVNSSNKKHKVIKIFGIKLKFKRHCENDDNEVRRFLSHDIRNKSVLLVELKPCHGECLPGMAKYFIDLGYNVDVLLNYKEARLNPLSGLADKNIKIFPANPSNIKHILCSDIVERYDYLYINSNKYSDNPVNKYLGSNIKYPAGKIIVMCHYAESYDEINFNTPNFEIVTLVNFPVLKEKVYKCINAHFFKDISKHDKNKISKFVVVGNIESFRKNHNILLDTVTKLDSEGITNFKIVIISRMGSLEIPISIRHYFEFKRNLSYPNMYNELEKADFLLTLFDADNPEHDRYITSGASGSYQLSYGFNLPVLIPYKFQTAVNRFNNLNSVGYKNNEDLINAMKFCINMENTQYNTYKSHLAALEKEIYNKSLNNLKEILFENKPKFQNNLFISLGRNCFNRVVLTRHHLKPRKSEGEMSLPFDLCVCPVMTVSKCLQNNFNNYFRDLKWDNKDNLWKNKRLKISYSHDIDCSRNDKNKLIDRYKQRINNFKQILDNNNEKIFILSLINPGVRDYMHVNDIYQFLNSKCHSEFKLIVVDLSSAKTLDEKLLNPDIKYKHIPHPYPNFWGEWFKGEYFNSPTGRAFEKEYINFITSCAGNKVIEEEYSIC